MIQRLCSALGWLIGIYFCPDNYVLPILRLGRYHRVRGPGFVWIIPLVEQVLAPVKTSLHVGDFIFQEVLSRDNIPFRVHMTVLFTFDPASAIKSAAAQLVRGGDQLLQVIVRDFANRRLRRLAATFEAEELSSEVVINNIEEGLVHYLKHEMSILGLAPIQAKYGGIMIKEVVAPDNFKRTMLDVKHDEAILGVLRNYPVPELVQLLNQVIFANSLKEGAGQLNLLLGTPEALPMLPFIGQNGK